MQQFNDTYDDGFSGGGLATLGAIAAGLKPIHAVEYDAAIADVYRRNIGDHVLVRPIQEVDWTALPVPYWRHMSPVCTRASQANSDGEESDLDLEMARAVARSIAVHPPMFSLENVWQYRNFESFKIILRALRKHGYAFDYWHLNAAHYGVPQTRKRLILVASRIKDVRRPQPTHAEPSELTPMFETRLPWVGWYAAIEDLIPTLPDSEFAPWQLERLPEKFSNFLIGGGNTNKDEVTSLARKACDPAFTVFANKPANQRAFIVDGKGNDHFTGVTAAGGDRPIWTITAQSYKTPFRAFLMRSANTQQEWGKGYRDDCEPSYTVATTDTSSRAWLQHGRVVKMIPRALARFQSVPDTYELPDKDSLACTVIGNGVPCRLMEAVINANR